MVDCLRLATLAAVLRRCCLVFVVHPGATDAHYCVIIVYNTFINVIAI